MCLIRSWVGLRAVVDDLEKRKISLSLDGNRNLDRATRNLSRCSDRHLAMYNINVHVAEVSRITTAFSKKKGGSNVDFYFNLGEDALYLFIYLLNAAARNPLAAHSADCNSRNCVISRSQCTVTVTNSQPYRVTAV